MAQVDGTSTPLAAHRVQKYKRLSASAGLGDLGDKRILILRNHGLMTVGKTVGEAFVWMYRIETACRIQIDALAGGAELQPISEATQRKSIEQGRRMYGSGGFIEAGKEWPALLRQLERVDGTSYRQ